MDVVVAGVGTGGTITGIARYLKNIKGKKDVTIVAVEPEGSRSSPGTGGKRSNRARTKFRVSVPVLSGNLDLSLIDRVELVSNEDAFATARKLMEREGILAGISSGAAVIAAERLAKEDKFKGKNIVVILPSSGERYLSTALFADISEN